MLLSRLRETKARTKKKVTGHLGDAAKGPSEAAGAVVRAGAGPIRKTKPGKTKRLADPDLLRKRIDRAILTLKRSIITAMRDGLVSKEKGMPINNQLFELDQAVSTAFPAPAADTESLARLPF
jgi:hypothetical protein